MSRSDLASSFRDRGRARVRSALDKQPFRGYPSFEDLLAVADEIVDVIAEMIEGPPETAPIDEPPPQVGEQPAAAGPDATPAPTEPPTTTEPAPGTEAPVEGVPDVVANDQPT